VDKQPPKEIRDLIPACNSRREMKQAVAIVMVVTAALLPLMFSFGIRSVTPARLSFLRISRCFFHLSFFKKRG